MKNSRFPVIATFGEALWDVLPRGIFLGGAPLNVAYHLLQNGVDARPITAVGADFLGKEIRRRLEGWKMDARFVADLRARPTGTVLAALDEAGVASYQIAPHVAWDRIPVAKPRRATPAPAALVFGTLALRETANRRALTQLCSAWPETLRVLDINLRPPFDRAEVVDFALGLGQVVKLNDDELRRLTGKRATSPAGLRTATQDFAATRGLQRVCVTAGARGAGLWWDGEWFWEAGKKVAVRDTVGAGDAFLAALLAGLLRQRLAPGEALARAARLGEFIAARDGATPPYRVTSRGEPRDA